MRSPSADSTAALIEEAPSRVPSGARVYAVGDIHGRLDLLEQLLAIIGDDVAAGAPGRPTIVFLGDMIDRGPHSRQVVERIAAGPPAAGPLAGAGWVALVGNHEDYMLRFLADPAVAPSWLRNGGLATIRSYAGGDPPGDDPTTLRDTLDRALPSDHLRFLGQLPAAHVEGDYLFVHAGVRPGVALARQECADLLWIREPFLGSAEPFGKMVVHGHTVVPEPDIRPNRIAIDTGAWRTGRLTALALEGAERRFLTATA